MKPNINWPNSFVDSIKSLLTIDNLLIVSIPLLLIGLSIFASTIFDRGNSSKELSGNEMCKPEQTILSFSPAKEEDVRYGICIDYPETKLLGIDVNFQNFIILMLATTVVLLGKELRDKSRIKKKEQEWDDRLRTMPPTEVLNSFRVLSEGIEYMTYHSGDSQPEQSQPNEKAGDVGSQEDQLVLYCLDNLASLAKTYNRHDHERYAANIMLFHEYHELTPEEKEAALNYSDTSNLEELEKNFCGFLVLNTRLSTSTDSIEFYINDGKLPQQPFVLPVPHDYETESMINALPGAPAAFLFSLFNEEDSSFNGNYHFNNTSRFFDKYENEKRYSFSSNLAKKIDSHFDAHKEIRSVLSLAIHDYSGSNPLGVLNIHSSSNEFFANDDNLHGFIDLISPVRLKLYSLLSA